MKFFLYIEFVYYSFMLTAQRLESHYSLDELEREFKAGILGYIKPSMEIVTEDEIRDDEDLYKLNKKIFETKQLARRYKIPYREIVEINRNIPSPINLLERFNGITHIIRIKWE